MHSPESRNNDVMGCRAALEEALAASELDEFDREGTPVSAEAKAAAYELAVALGKCRIFGVDAGELDGTLPENIAIAAAEVLSEQLTLWTQDAAELGSRWEEALDPIEAEELCLGLIEARMDAWAAWLAIEEALFSSEEKLRPEASRVFDLLERGLVAFDEALQTPENLALLATAADTYLLTNWRAALAGEFRELPPWWLDGTLEQIAEENYQQMLQELPRRKIPVVQTVLPIVLQYRQWLNAPSQLAAAEAISQPRRPLRWDHPAGRATAYMHLPQSAEEYLLRCYTAEGDPAAELAGRAVRLDGVPATLDAQGQATFPRQRLAEAPVQEARLEVQDEQGNWVTWNLQEY